MNYIKINDSFIIKFGTILSELRDLESFLDKLEKRSVNKEK